MRWQNLQLVEKKYVYSETAYKYYQNNKSVFLCH